MNMAEVMALARQFQQFTPNEVDPANKNYVFWDTQPVPKFSENIDPETNTCIEPDLSIAQIRADPYTLPDAFSWSDVDLNNSDQLKELYTLLTENYVEDEDNMFRFDYSSEFLSWALKVPGWLPQWHCGVRAKASGKLVAFISAVPQTLRVYEKTVKMVEINFLCVHKRLRSKRVAPVLIREITRRVNLEGIFQAAYTAGIVIPKPIAVCRYWHRSLNPKKLIDCKFSHLPPKMTLSRTIKLYKVPAEPATRGIRAIEDRDYPGAYKILNEHLNKYSIAPILSLEEFKYIFTPRDKVVYAYVVENEGKVTDFVSFYNLPSSVMQHPVHKTINAAYLYYHVATTVPIKQLISDALVFAVKNCFDVFNALDLMGNQTFLEELKFGIGDGNLQYYLYNWKCPSMEASQTIISVAFLTSVLTIGTTVSWYCFFEAVRSCLDVRSAR